MKRPFAQVQFRSYWPTFLAIIYVLIIGIWLFSSLQYDRSRNEYYYSNTDHSLVGSDHFHGTIFSAPAGLLSVPLDLTLDAVGVIFPFIPTISYEEIGGAGFGPSFGGYVLTFPGWILGSLILVSVVFIINFFIRKVLSKKVS